MGHYAKKDIMDTAPLMPQSFNADNCDGFFKSFKLSQNPL